MFKFGDLKTTVAKHNGIGVCLRSTLDLHKLFFQNFIVERKKDSHQMSAIHGGFLVLFKDDVAKRLEASLSFHELLNIIKNPEWKGSDLILMDNVFGRPSAQVLARNAIWLKPFMESNRSKAKTKITRNKMEFSVFLS